VASSPGSSYSQEGLKDDLGNEVRVDTTDNCTLEKKKKILKLIEKNPNWKLKTIQRHGGKEFKHNYYKSRWEAQVKSGGTQYEKYSYIDNFVYSKYKEARKNLHAVRNIHLRRWAMQASQTFLDPRFTFKASARWLTNFKSRRGISSRKITRLVSRRQFRSFEAILEQGKKFQTELAAAATSFDPDLVLNTDQTGFVYEITPKRTFADRGEKSTLVVAKSPNNLATHSYTVQYTISKSGKIVGDVYLCLQEKSGRLGPIVQLNLFPAPNVTVTCSTSGKLTSTLVEYYLDQVLLKAVDKDFMLVLDSWTGQKDRGIFENRFGIDGKPLCTLKYIPEKCTDTCQPLDTTFHLQLKYFAKAIYAEASLAEPEETNPVDEITTRNNIIRTHSLLHNQMSAKIFVPLIQYSWFSAGLTSENPLFDSVSEACFTFDAKEPVKCRTENCQNNRFVKCSHCRLNLCFSCFYYDYHFHY